MAAGYPEDKDEGLEFTYTGSGGRNLKDGNKRVAAQTSDQELTMQNEALARTCDCPFNVKGGSAKNWKKSQGVRVIRGYTLRKHNPLYAPLEGFRYDGIYKLVKVRRCMHVHTVITRGNFKLLFHVEHPLTKDFPSILLTFFY